MIQNFEFQTEHNKKKHVFNPQSLEKLSKMKYARIFIYVCKYTVQIHMYTYVYIWCIYIYMYSLVHPSIYSGHLSCTCIYIYIIYMSRLVFTYTVHTYPAHELPTWAKLRNKSHLPLAGSACIFLAPLKEKNDPKKPIRRRKIRGKVWRLNLAAGSETRI